MLLVLFFVTLLSPALAETQRHGGGGLVLSSNCDGYLAGVPEGWVLDNGAAASQGVDMLFYLEGANPSNLNSLNIYAYVMPTVKAINGKMAPSADELAREAFSEYRKSDDSATLSKQHYLLRRPQSVSKLTTYEIIAPKLNKYENIAYIENDRVIFAIVLSASSKSLLSKHSVFMKEVIESGLILSGDRQDGVCKLENGSAVSN
jgi:hypothetical protein